jgi:WD40 repeat protein
VNAVAFSLDGRHVVSGSSDGTLRLWEVESGQQLVHVDGDFGFHALHLAPDGKSLVAGDRGGCVHLLCILINDADKAAWLTRERG